MKKVISVLTAIAILMTVTLNIFADQIENKESDSFITEDISRREENVKHFSLGNGVYQAVAYSHPVHKLDSEGNWQNISNSLSLSGIGTSATYKTSDSRVSFAQSYRADQPIMTLQEEGKTIEMFLHSKQTSVMSISSGIPATVDNAQISTQYATIEQAANAKLTSSVLYENVIGCTDLEYIIDGDVVKENIIVDTRSTSYDYIFSLVLSGLYAQLESDGSVGIYDSQSNKQKYTIPAPYMYDANYELSEEISYQLTGGAERYVLLVDASEEWINAKERAFPVTIDPSFVVSTLEAQDTYISRSNPDATNGSKSFMLLEGDNIAYIKVPSFTVPNTAELDWAYLTAFYYFPGSVTSGSATVRAYQVNNYWHQSTLNWNIMSSISNFGLSAIGLDDKVIYGSVGATATAPRQIDFSITQAARVWRSESATFTEELNFGIALKRTATTGPALYLKSYESGQDHRPRITFQYRTNCFKYTCYYDSESFGGTQLTQLQTALQNACNLLENQFGITMEVSTLPVHKDTILNECDSEINETCNLMTCTAHSENLHHKDLFSISTQFFNMRPEPNEIIVYWTDRPKGTFCQHAFGDCRSANAHAVVYNKRPVVHIVDPETYGTEDPATEYVACMTILLLHETAHTFGLDEIYEINPNHESQNSWSCVMNRYKSDPNSTLNFYESLLSSLSPDQPNGMDAFCEYCESLLGASVAQGLHASHTRYDGEIAA